MNELSARDVDRMCREMVLRFREVAAPDAHQAAAAIGLIMAEYPPAVAHAYYFQVINQLIRGETTTIRATKQLGAQ